MPALEAEDVIRERGPRLTPESLKSQVLLATGGDEDAAEQAYCDAVLAQEKA